MTSALDSSDFNWYVSRIQGVTKMAPKYKQPCDYNTSRQRN